MSSVSYDFSSNVSEDSKTAARKAIEAQYGKYAGVVTVHIGEIEGGLVVKLALAGDQVDIKIEVVKLLRDAGLPIFQP